MMRDVDSRDDALDAKEASAFFLRVSRKVTEIEDGAPAHLILETRPTASPSETRSAYRRLAKVYHPDSVFRLIEQTPSLRHDLERILRALAAARKGMLARPRPESTDRARVAASESSSLAAGGDGRLDAQPRGARRSTLSSRRPKRGKQTASMAFAAGATAMAERDAHAAVGHFRTAVEMAPDDAEFLRALGEALLESAGDPAEIDEALSRSVEIDPKSVTAWLLLGEARERAGQIANARAAYESALALDPGHLRAALGLARTDAAAVTTPPPRGFVGRLRRLTAFTQGGSRKT